MRIFKAARQVDGLKFVMNSILSSLSGLGDVMFICALSIFLFGVVCVQLFGGTFSYRCVNEGDYSYDPDEALFCNPDMTAQCLEVTLITLINPNNPFLLPIPLINPLVYLYLNPK